MEEKSMQGSGGNLDMNKKDILFVQVLATLHKAHEYHLEAEVICSMLEYLKIPNKKIEQAVDYALKQWEI